MFFYKTNMLSPIPIFSTTEEEDVNENICTICLDNMQVPELSHTLVECSHKFHNDCIIKWLRTGNIGCPVCRGEGEMNLRNQNDRTSILRLIISYSKRKDACKKIKKLVKKYSDSRQKMKEIEKELRDFKKENKEIFKKKNNLFTKMWTARRKFRRITIELSNIPIRPVLIKKK